MILMLGGWLLNIKFSTKKNDNIDVSNNNDFVALVGDGNVDTDIGVSHMVDVSDNYDFVARGDGSHEELSDEAKLFSIPSEATAVEELCPQNR